MDVLQTLTNEKRFPKNVSQLEFDHGLFADNNCHS